jgi:hypothetical protein
MNLTMTMDIHKAARDLLHYIPNLQLSEAWWELVNLRGRPITFIIILQIHFAKLHVDENIGGTREFSVLQNFDNILMCSIAKLLDCPKLISHW